MKYKKSLIFICLIICLFSIASVCASEVNGTVVTSEDQNDDVIEIDDENDNIFAVEEQDNDEVDATEEDELSASPGTFTDLAIDIKNADDTLNLKRDYAYSSDDSIYKDGITINKKITINGNGKTIDAKSLARIFKIEENLNITIKDLILTNGHSDADGGAIYLSNSNLTVIDCTFNSNDANTGGAIYAYESNVVLNHNRFFKNQIGIECAGGDLIARKTNVELFNNIFEDSYAGGGGSLQLLMNGKEGVTATLIDNVFKNCTAKYAAGFFYSSLPTTVINCTFENYDGSEYGGVVVDNDLNIYNSVFRNSFDLQGGALSLHGVSKNSNVINCTFENNRASTYGGAILCEQKLTIHNTDFINNTAGADGGAIYVSGNADNSVFWADFENNFANNSGGAIYVSESILNSLFSGNFNNNQANNYGGAIYAKNIASSTLNGNFKDSSAGLGGALYCNISDSTFNGDFEDNYADYGGAVFGNITDSIFNGDFTGNGAGAGGAIYGNVADSIFNGDFIYNTATNVASQMSEPASGDVLGSTENDMLSFMPAMTVGGGVLYGNVASSTFNSNFVANFAKIGAVIAGNVEKSVFTGKFSKNTADSGIIVSGNTLKSVFSGSGEDIIEFEGKLFGDLLDSHIKDQNMNKEDKERLENLSEYFVDIEADLNIYVDGNANSNDNIAVTYHLNLLNLVLDKTVDLGLSKLKKVANPLEGPLGIVADNLLDGALGRITEKVTGDRLKGYLTYEIRNVHNLKDAIDIANNLGLLYKNPYTRLNIKFSLDDLSVKIAPGVYRGDKNKGLEITTNYTLMKDGEGDVIIDAENEGNIITAKWPEITIDGLTFMHASDSAIIFEKGLFDSVINANFIENYRIENIDDNPIPLKEGGSAINFKGDIKNSTITGIFQNNYAKNVYSGTIGAVGHNIEDCIFNGTYINNTGFYTNGALLWCDKIINSIFSGNFIENKAYDNPGIIWANTIDGSTFSGNFINNLGIGLYDPRLIKCNTILDSKFNGYFSNNYFQSGVIGAGKFSNCIFDGVFKNNSVMMESYYGWGIIHASDTILKSIFNGTFIDNKARAVIAVQEIQSEELIDCDFSGTFKYNTYTSSNGTIYRSYVYHYVCWGKQNEFILACSDNSISSSEFDNILIVPSNEIYVDGSALSNGDGNINNPYNNLKSAIVNANDRDTIYIAPGTYVGENNIGLTINKPLNLIKNGKGEVVFDSENTGRIFTINNDSFNITGLTFTHATDSAIVFNNGLFNSKIEANFYDNKKANGDGAALYIHGYVFNCVFNGDYIGNSAANGGAVCAEEIISSKFNGVFTNNTANNGGAIKAAFIDSIINADFTNNTANVNGGAIIGNVASSLINGNFKNNKAANGGAIYANISSSSITGDFKGNGAANGGSIYGKISSSNFTGDFNDNSAVNGGAINGAISNSNFKCNFMKNNADKGSAAYSNKDISKSLFKGSFTDNTAVSDNGKLVYVEGSISNSNFIGDVFVNSSNINEIVYSLKGLVVNCVFSNASTNDPDNTQQSETNTTRDNDSGREDDIIYDVADVKVVMKQSSVLYTGKYSVIIQGKDGKTASGISVMFKINGKTVKTAKTNSKGVATFNIPSKYVPKKYTIKAIVFGMSSSKKVTVKQILKIKTVKVKKSAKKLVLTATLKKVDGKYLKNKKITFKFNGKKFVVKTNKKGIAKVIIKKSILKKLKVGKKVTYQATYLKDTVKKTVKVKK